MAPKSGASFKDSKEAALDTLARSVEESLDMEKLLEIIGF